MDNVSSLASPHDDGAGEKLVDEKNGHNSKGVEVIKYMTPTSQNGEAKIDIENIKTAFAGMGKEELMKFANDPFWVRTRWFLFILFWLLWIAMLAGAIAIIVLAPKCAPPTPREWWEQSPVYKANVAAFGKGPGSLQGDLKGFSSKLDYLKKLGVKTVVLSNILKVGDSNSDGKEEFKTIAPAFGTLDDFKVFISAAKEKGLNLLLTLVPNHSSLKNNFFNESLSKDSKYSSFYVWAPAKDFDAEGKRVPPNNWLSQDGGSAWEWNEQRQEFYLHQFGKDQPEFNFHNPEVVKYFNEVMQYWLGIGVSGFYLERTPYLLEDVELRNETRQRDIGSFDHTQYGYYDHMRTKNLPELTPLLRKWKGLVANHSGIVVMDEVTSDRSVAHLTVLPQTLPAYPQLSAYDVQNLVNRTLSSNSWPVWQVKVKDEEEGSEISRALLLTTMLLPGVPVTVAGQELGVVNLQDIPADKIDLLGKETPEEEEKRGLDLFGAYKLLVKERTTASILYGSWKLHVFNGTSVFAYTRLKSGSPGYLVAFNVGEEGTLVDARQLSSVPDDLTPILSSDFTSKVEDKVKSEAVTLPGRTVAVFSFVPKAKE